MPESAKIQEPTKRGRRKKADVHPDASAPPPAGAKPGHNGIDRDGYLFHKGRIDKIDAEIAALRTKRKTIRRAAKDAGMHLARFDLLNRLANLEDETPDQWLADLRKEASWLQLATGTQPDMFSTDDDKTPEQKGMEKAFQRGYRLGVEGANAEFPEYHEGAPMWQEALRGWHEGQKVNLDRIQRLEPETQPDPDFTTEEDAGHDVEDQPQVWN